MASQALPSPEVVRQLLRYEADTGKLFWRERPVEFFISESVANSWNARFLGREAMTATSGEGYRNGRLLGKHVKAHRAILAIVNGAWPEYVDHINGIRTDNRLANLREVSKQENARNMKKHVGNTSGVTGVHFRSDNRTWVAQIGVDLGRKYLGAFPCFEDAVAARRSAEIEHGFHENHGR